MKRLLSLLCCLALPAFAEPGTQEVVELPDEVAAKTTDLNPKYLLFTPKNNSKDHKSPLIIFLHGSGERGTDIDLVKVHGPPKIVDKKPDFEFMVLSPQCLRGEGRRTRWRTKDLEELLGHVLRTGHVDESRIYLTGLSMGGFGSWAWAAEHPERFAAVAPICGRGNPKDAKKYGDLPIWAFHGDQDRAVPLKGSTDIVEAIQKAGGKAKLTVYEGVGHDSWTRTYNNPELYKWFLSHKRR